MAAVSVDALLAEAGIDPADGVQVVAASRLAAIPFDPGLPLLILPSAGPSDAALPGRHARSGLRDLLLSLYPGGHPIRPLPQGEERRLDQLDEAFAADGATAWLLPPLTPLDNLASPHGMAAISARLRAPDGCPWDRKQTHASLRPFVLEEAYEAVDAIEQGSPADLAEELGDLFLQIILHAQLAAEEGEFDLTDVYRTLGAKIVRRHPHVFGDVEVADAAEVLRNWEAIKADERTDAGSSGSPFAGIARALPALPASREIQERAASLGWDWPSIDGVWEKVSEELDELRDAAATGESANDARLHELGDVLFATVNLARWLKLDPEEALRTANRRWIARYERVEALAASRGQMLAELSPEAKDKLWNEVKGS